MQRAHDPQDRRRINIELVADKIVPIISRYGQYSDTLGQANADFSEEELSVVTRYLERIGSTF